MAASLDGVLLKIERATEHFQAVRELVQAVSRGPLDSIKFERDEETRQTTIILKELPTPDPRVGVVIGDCLQNFRAALDHMAFQLVKYPAQRGKQKPTPDGDIYFPLYLKPRDSSGSIRGSTPRAQAIIDALQPHRAGKDARKQPLGLLGQLNNWDKHRVLHTVANTLKQSTLGSGKQALEVASVRAPGPLVAGAELASYRPPADSKVGVYYHATFGVSFKDGPGTGRDVMDTLSAIADAVERVIIALLNEVEFGEGSAEPPLWARFIQAGE